MLFPKQSRILEYPFDILTSEVRKKRLFRASGRLAYENALIYI